ncbi:MAG: hypothetical protein AB1627_03560 [Chloroflexota bacterium]
MVTNEHGVCRIRNLPAVAYELRIILEGHSQDDPAATAKVLLVGDETVTVRIQLSR